MFVIKGPASNGAVDHFGGPEIVDIGVTCTDGMAVITVSGELDVSNTTWLYECLHDAIDAGVLEVVVDIEHVTFMDSTGATVLAGAQKRLRAVGGTLTLLSPAPAVTRLLDASHLVPSLTVNGAA
jgi:anti-anti-sigma factor